MITNACLETVDGFTRQRAALSDATATGDNSLTNQPVDTYFNPDGTINPTGQTALTGVGWNGSNIAQWAWADTSGTSPVYKSSRFI